MTKQERLVALLNQCLSEQGKEYRFIGIKDDDFFILAGSEMNGLGYETIFSRKFGFIERLYEKGHIATSKKKYYAQLFKNGQQMVVYSYESLIMELSINQTPVKYLCSLLE